MADPITAAIIAGLAAQKFAEGAAGKAAAFSLYIG